MKVDLAQEEVYRVKDPRDKVYVTLLKGTAEVFGEELLILYRYEFEAHQSFSIFTWIEAQLEIQYQDPTDQAYPPGCKFNDEDSPYGKMMQNILKINHLLESYRSSSMKSVSEFGPRVLIIGSKSSGKNTLTKTLLNYSSVYGWKPIYVDLDPDQQNRNHLGAISAEIYYNRQSDKQTQKLSFYFGYKFYEQIKDSSIKLLYNKMVENLGQFAMKKLELDLIKQQEAKRIFLQQYSQHEGNPNMKKLCEMVFQKFQEDKDEKCIFASGMFINSPTLQGLHRTNADLYKRMISYFQINMVICIDLPDVYSYLEQNLDQSDLILHKMEKLKGVVDNPIAIKFEDYIKQFSGGQYLKCSCTLQQDQFHIYELQQREDDQVIFQKSKEQSLVRCVIGVLHLKWTQVAVLEDDKTLQKNQKDMKISNLIFQSPLAFLGYIAAYKNGYVINVPDQGCIKILENNICVIGR